jgi:hypothetical protein
LLRRPFANVVLPVASGKKISVPGLRLQPKPFAPDGCAVPVILVRLACHKMWCGSAQLRQTVVFVESSQSRNLAFRVIISLDRARMPQASGLAVDESGAFLIRRPAGGGFAGRRG